MLTRWLGLAVGLLLGMMPATFATAQAVSTEPWESNGNPGLMFDVQANRSLTVTTLLSAGRFAGTFELYHRPGSYVGHEASGAGWTLVDTVAGTRGQDTVRFSLSQPVAAGETHAFYIHAVTGQVGYTTSTNGAGSVWASDANFIIREGVGLTTLFGGQAYTPRSLGGSVSYVLDAPPVPTLSEWMMILLGIVLAGTATVAVARRRSAG